MDMEVSIAQVAPNLRFPNGATTIDRVTVRDRLVARTFECVIRTENFVGTHRVSVWDRGWQLVGEVNTADEMVDALHGLAVEMMLGKRVAEPFRAFLEQREKARG